MLEGIVQADEDVDAVLALGDVQASGDVGPGEQAYAEAGVDLSALEETFRADAASDPAHVEEGRDLELDQIAHDGPLDERDALLEVQEEGEVVDVAVAAEAAQ